MKPPLYSLKITLLCYIIQSMSDISKCNPWDMDPANLELCPLARACSRGELGPLIGRASITRNTCAVGNEGRYCGPATAYYEGALTALYQDALDQLAPVSHTITITSTPEGDAPEKVRNSVVGTSVYARQSLLPEGHEEEFVAVHATDFILALHADAKFDAASWYANNHKLVQDPSKEMPIWVFSKSDVDVYEARVSGINSVAKYGDFAWSMSGLYAIWSGFLMHPEAFSPSSTKGQLYYEAMREIADEEFNGDIGAAITSHLSETIAYGSFDYITSNGIGRTSTVDGTGLKEIRDDGRLIYDRESGVDFRENPDDAPPREEHMIDRFHRKLEKRQLSGMGSYVTKLSTQ
jgi:hypothetical protein